MSTSSSLSPREQAELSTNSFLDGTGYEKWTVHASLHHKEDARVGAATLEAPADVETSKPYVFLAVNGRGERVVIEHSDPLPLMIETAHRWLNTSDLDGLDQDAVASILCVYAFSGLSDSSKACVLSTIHTLILSNGSEGEDGSLAP